MPVEQPFFRERIFEFLGGVEHHLDHAFDMAVSGGQGSGFDPEPARNRGSDFSLVEDFAFDLAGFEHVLGEDLENGLLAHRKSQCLHAADQSSLAMPDGSKLSGKAVLIPGEFGPGRQLVDIGRHVLPALNMQAIRRIGKIIAAHFAEITKRIRRISLILAANQPRRREKEA
jgi:hypothetical protein